MSVVSVNNDLGVVTMSDSREDSPFTKDDIINMKTIVSPNHDDLIGLGIITSNILSNIEIKIKEIEGDINTLYRASVSPVNPPIGFAGPMNPMNETIQRLQHCKSMLETISDTYHIPIKK